MEHLTGIAAAANALPRVYEDAADADARQDMAMAALLSGITLSNAGLGAVHGFAVDVDQGVAASGLGEARHQRLGRGLATSVEEVEQLR